MSLYNDLNSVLTPYANKIKQNEANVRLALSLEGGGAPIVVSNTSAMTDMEQIYVLATDGKWYYHNGTAWTAGGEYGAVATDTTLTQAGIPADAKTVGDAINAVTSDVEEVQDALEHLDVETDPTLSIDGKPADAKVTGDRISNLESGLASQSLDLTWVQGSIATNNGTDSSDNIKCRTVAMHEYSQLITVEPKAGIKFSWRLYGNSGNFISSSDWISEKTQLKFEEGQKVRFVCGRINGNKLSPEDVSGEIDFTISSLIDDTLSIRGKAADAKKTGDKFKALEWTDSLKYKNVSPIWTIGAINTQTGENTTSTNTLRTNEFFEADGARITLNTQNNVVYALRYYDANKNFVSSDSEVRSEDMNLADIISVDTRIVFFRIIARYKNASAIDSEAKVIISGSITIQLKFDIQNDIKKLCVEPEVTPFNSMLGNISIKAAKTIYFSDGTAPIIDWYLLVDKDGRFYKSKDLVSKTYLFSFDPPSGAWANWSAGIMANNDIIFVRDAESLKTPNGRLNDANRVNPACYLAAENYSSRHVIDFGTNLRPCGWLTNVGYLVLPNGNSVFCEYTRGTVKTANVWVVNGDVTDPSSWSTKWSANIIDDTGVTAPGIKHCHEMQYDFYTGVLYFGTGDSPQGSYNYYSIDNGQTWTLLYGPDKDKCRRLTYVFTENKVYWASDSYEPAYHHFFIADRTAGGIVDIENAQSIQLQSDNGQACYGCVYLKSLNTIVLMDRCDLNKKIFYWYCYDIDSAEIKLIGTIKSPDENVHNLGFRAKFIDWYPDGDSITIGFPHTAAAIAIDTNQNALCGNLGGASGDGSTRINNLKIFICKNNGAYSYKASTIWC